VKFEIKHKITGDILYSVETETLGLAVEKAVRSNVSLRSANLQGADLHGADLHGADLQGADLQGADLHGAYLLGANLRVADLQYANLREANLHGAYLREAYFRGAELRKANGINKNICTPLQILLDQPGKIRAYKLVTTSGTGPHYPSIVYEIGKSYEVSDACIDDTAQCAAGINVATLDWCMKEWMPGYRILVVEFEAKDIACIPIVTDGKFRLFRCTVVGEKDLDEIGLTQ
jgi:hypothetical protein